MAGATPVKPAGKPAKGPRPKHVPQRMCIACRERSAKRTLIRIVREPDGTVAVDPTGRKNGRGAYLCDDPTCWQRALASGQLARALKVDLTTEATDTLRQYGANLPPVPAPAPDSEPQTGHHP